MRRLAATIAAATAALLLSLHPLLAEAPAANNAAPTGSLNITGKVVHPGAISLDAIQKLPAQTLDITITSEHGASNGRFSGPLLWAVLQAAGGLDDPAKPAALHHTLKRSAGDGYYVVLSTGEIAPDFGAKQAIIATQRDDKPIGGTGFRLIIPGEKLGGRDIRDITTIDVE